MAALSPKQSVVLTGIKCNSLPKIAKVNVEQHFHQIENLSPSPACSDAGEAASRRLLPPTETSSFASHERVPRAQSLYTLVNAGNNEYQTTTLVNLMPTSVHSTPIEYDIIDHAEDAAPGTPSISVNDLSSGPGNKTTCRIGVVVVCVLMVFVILSVIILGVYFVKRDEFGTTDHLVGYELSVMNRNDMNR